VTDPVAGLRRDYTPPFLSYLTRLDEAGLSAAYELGRQAIDQNIGLLDLVRVHNDVYTDVVSTARSLEEAQGLARAASAFLLEAIASFEMTQRAFMAGDRLTRRSPEPGSDS
jgi:Phosphoserine phosphatase RsbU, N-terminal domain